MVFTAHIFHGILLVTIFKIYYSSDIEILWGDNTTWVLVEPASKFDSVFFVVCCCCDLKLVLKVKNNVICHFERSEESCSFNLCESLRFTQGDSVDLLKHALSMLLSFNQAMAGFYERQRSD
jgi:hypothetical protein